MWIKIPQTSTTTTVLNIFTATTGYSQANCGNRKRMITFDSRNTPSYDIQYMEQPDGGTACQSGQPIVSFGITPDNTWHNIVVVKNGTSIITYTDGVQKNSSTGGYTGKTGMNNVTILGEGGSCALLIFTNLSFASIFAASGVILPLALSFQYGYFAFGRETTIEKPPVGFLAINLSSSLIGISIFTTVLSANVLIIILYLRI